MSAHSLQSLVDQGYGPSVRWFATGIKAGTIPGRMIGRYWGNWLLTDSDLEMFLEGTKPEPKESAPVVEEVNDEPDLIVAGLSARTARRLKRAS